jgi:phage terminase large subunit-like protein
VVTITQSARNLNDATVATQLLTKGGRIEYDRENELLTWSIVNAAIVRNSFGEIKIDKKPGAKTKRIDAVDAWIDAHTLMLVQNGGEAAVDVSTELDNYLAMMGWAVKEE